MTIWMKVMIGEYELHYDWCIYYGSQQNSIYLFTYIHV